MIIGIDLHGVIDSDIKWAKKVLDSLMFDFGINIISGPPAIDIEKELNDHGLYRDIHFDAVFSIVDFLKEKGVKMWLDGNSRWWASEENWWSSKAEICEKYKVDIMIDDKEKYKQYFKGGKTKFLLYTE